MTVLEKLNATISQELQLTISQHQLQETQQKQALDDWLAANRVNVLAALDTIATMSVTPLQTKILANGCVMVGLQKQYQIELTIESIDLRATLDDALSCPRCLKLLILITEYNEMITGSLIMMGGIRKLTSDGNQYIVHYSTR
jgi:hypothetical protein